MLVYQDGWVGVEHTGYPLPDCTLPVANGTLRGQENILRAILGYDLNDTQSFVSKVSRIQPMTYDAFRRKIILEEIGGGCPKWIKTVTETGEDSKLSHNQARFKYLLPISCVNPSCALPSDEDITAEYGELLGYNWNTRQNEPNWRFRNNIILFTGCREVTDKHIDMIKDVVAICMRDSEKSKYKYVSGVTLSNGNGAIMLLDSYIGNCDIAYLYQSVTSADLSAGRILCDVNGDSVQAHYQPEYRVITRKKMPEISGVVHRCAL